MGQKIKHPELHIALLAIAEFPKEMVNILSEIHIDHNQQLVVYTIHGVQGRFGYPAEVAQKGHIFLQALNQPVEGQKIKYIDITSFKLPVIKYE